MGKLENKFTQTAVGTKNEEKEKSAAEKKAAENAEVNISPEQVEVFAKEKESEITKVGENAAQEGSQAFENAVGAGNRLGLKEGDISQISGEMHVEENLQVITEKAVALTGEAKAKISKVVESGGAAEETIETGEEKNSKVAEVQPESAQEEKINENVETNEAAKETTETTKSAETTEATEEEPKYSEDEARKKDVWKSLNKEEQLAFCKPDIVAKEMSDDLQLKNSPESKSFSGELFSENSEVVNENIKNLVEGYIGEAKISKEYGEKIRKSTEDYIGLISKAQQEDGSIDKDLKAGDIQKISEDIVNKMVYQNRESLKRGLGDHGVRHIIDGNIAEAMKMIDSYNKANPEKPLSAKDRLKMMTLHFNHDMGYTVKVNTKGMDTLKSHPMFSQKLFDGQREMYGKLFDENDLTQISETIKTHDEETIDFKEKPLESIARLSDNMGLFSDSKLPEIFYSVPENMAVLQKIDLARKAGQSIDGLKEKLKENVMKQEGLDDDTRKALFNAAGEINDKAPDFNLGMLAGKLDGYEMQGDEMIVNMRESDMHSQIQQLFELNQKQFVKALDSYKIKLEDGVKFDDYVAEYMKKFPDETAEKNGIKYIGIPPDSENPALRFNFLREDLNNSDEKNAEVKKKFAETATEWAGINIRTEINSAVKELKESKESRTSENIDKIYLELKAQLSSEKVSAEDGKQIRGLISNLEGFLDDEDGFSDKLDQLGKFLTKKEKDFLAVS